MEPHPDGWWFIASDSRACHWQRPKAGDLTQFGKINKRTPISFGPGSIFAGKKGNDPESRDPRMSKRNWPQTAPSQRPKLQLLPRSKRSEPAEEESTAFTPVASEYRSNNEATRKTDSLTPVKPSEAESKSCD